MSKKNASRKKAGTKKPSSKNAGKSTERLRKEAIASIDKRLGGAKRGKRASSGGTAAPKAATGKPVAKATRKARAGAEANTGERSQRRAKTARGPSGLDYAGQVLAAAKEPLACRAIAERAIAAGWKTSGKTPHATLYAAIIREIATKGSESRFKKTDRGLFTSTGKGA